MQELIIQVNKIEDLQNISNIPALEKIFTKAKSTIVNGEKVLLARKEKDGRLEMFDSFTTLEDLEAYRLRVFRYLL
jgi:hypothetical protein